MESSGRDISIEMVVDRFIVKNSQITLSPCLTFIPKKSVGRGAFDSAKNHKRQRRKRQSVTAKREKSQTLKFV